MTHNKKSSILVASIIFIAIVFKIYLLVLDVIPFNSDEAIVGLMAKHILDGQYPVFFYGQSYMGSLDAFLIAGVFKIIGEKVIAIRIVQIILYSLVLLTSYIIGKRVFHSTITGIFAVLLLAVPPVNVTLYSTVSLGGYSEALLVSNLLFITGFLLLRKIDAPRQEKSHNNHLKLIPGIGLYFFLMGFGIWVNGITLVYSVPIGLMLFIQLIQTRNNFRLKTFVSIGFVSVLCGLIGLFPWVRFAFQHGSISIYSELFGNAVNVEMGSFFQKTVSHIINYFLLGSTVVVGLRPPWEVRWLSFGLIPLIVIFWILVFGFWGRRLFSRHNDKKNQDYMVAGVFLFQFLGFIFTPFGIDPSGRYFLPLAVPLALIAGEMVKLVKSKKWQVSIIMVVVIFQMIGTLQCAYRYPPGITTQFDLSTTIDHRYDEELIEFLEENDAYYGFTNYWVAYPLAFSSDEELIYIPVLPYHQDLRYTARDNRYDHYNIRVAESSKAAYITTKNPRLDENIENGLIKNEIVWEEKNIGDYHIYYNLSKLIRPDELNLGY